MEYIDCFYYINLEHRTDRKEQIESEFAKLGIPKEKIVRIDAHYTKGFGILGCGLSHLKAVETFIQSEYKNCIIFEDDFMFTLDVNYIKYLVKSIFKKNIKYDVVMLGGNLMKSEKTEHDFLNKVIDAQTASSYLITRDFAPKLLETYKESTKLLKEYKEQTGEKKHEYCNDIYWKKLQPESNWYILNPKCGYQRQSYSDNEEHVTDYKV